MTRVLIRAEVSLAGGLSVGHPPTVVEKTPFIATLAADGKITILEEYDDDEPDPEPGDPDFDEYDSTFDEELPAPLPPKPRKGTKGT